MTKVLLTESHLEDIADAIRGKLGVQTTYTPGQMAGAIESIPTGGSAVLVTKTITENGTYDASDDDADGYSEVTVNVSGSSSAYPVFMSASSTISGTAQYTPYAAYGTELENFWGSNGGGTDWLKMEFQNAIIVSKVQFGNTLNLGSTHWSSTRVIFQASNDGSTWTDLYDAQNLTDDNNNLFEQTIQNATAYKYYRFLCYKGSFWAGVGRVQLTFSAA